MCKSFRFTPNTVRGSRPGKNVQLTEAEIRGLCLKSREIFLSQPILLELEAPLKICGEYVKYRQFICVMCGIDCESLLRRHRVPKDMEGCVLCHWY